MLAIERRAEIMSIISREHSVKVSALSDRYDVTEETIRRDLDKLDKEGKLKKTYGGAVLDDQVSEDPSFTDRLKENMKQKRAIASYAHHLIEDGETIFLDMSTTALEVVNMVEPPKRITVITNSLIALSELSKKDNITLISIGGTFNNSTLSMDGPMTRRFIDLYHADKTLFSVKGISKERGITDSNEEVAEIKHYMVKNARENILLIDSSKFDKSAMVGLIEMHEVDRLVTDYELDDAWRDYFAKKNVEAICVNH